MREAHRYPHHHVERWASYLAKREGRLWRLISFPGAGRVRSLGKGADGSLLIATEGDEDSFPLTENQQSFKGGHYQLWQIFSDGRAEQWQNPSPLLPEEKHKWVRAQVENFWEASDHTMWLLVTYVQTNASTNESKRSILFATRASGPLLQPSRGEYRPN